VNLVHTSVAPALCLAFGLALAACQPAKPAGTSNPPGEGRNAAGASSSDPSAANSDSGSTSTDEPANGVTAEGPKAPPKQCDAQVADVPTALFDSKVLVRPPINVELIEENPTYAKTYADFVSACEATVDAMNLFVFENDKKKTMAVYMDEIIDQMLPKSGFANGKRGKNHVESANDLHTEVEYAAGNGTPPAKLYVAATRKQQFILVAIYQTRPDEFSVLLPTFTASAKTIFVVP